jgi:hypothetical protein
MLRELARVARQRGVPKSQLVREALEAYLTPKPGPADVPATAPATAPLLSVRDRTAPYIGVINLSGPGDAEAIADRVRRRNWREGV